MFLLPFKKKKEQVKKVYVPVDLVLSYSSQGLSENEIKSRLQAEGFSQDIIDKALRVALKEKVTSELPQVAQPQTEAPRIPQPMPMDTHVMPREISRHPAPLGYPPERIVSPDEPKQLPAEEAAKPFTFEPTQIKAPESPIGEITIEEIIEGVVDERWQDFEERLVDFEKRDMLLQAQIEDLRKRLKEIENKLLEKEKGLVVKLDEFGGSVENIEGRIGSIEKVFKDFLPELTQNIKNMSELVDKIKEKEKGH
jgi:SOS response regulatory protein OraA/RecX